MKKTKLFSLVAASMAVAFVACNNESDNTAATDSTITENTTATTTSATGDYSALADSFRINSEAGNYLDARTGKPLRITVDPQTGARLNAETNEPVWRYVDRRNWWVYGGDYNTNSMWDTIGTARMQGNKIQYDRNGQWVDYDSRWKVDDDRLNNDWKLKSGDTKIKVSKDGDIKIKDESGKVKYDADDNKIKRDSSD